jgi:hypothetical protein
MYLKLQKNLKATEKIQLKKLRLMQLNNGCREDVSGCLILKYSLSVPLKMAEAESAFV